MLRVTTPQKGQIGSSRRLGQFPLAVVRARLFPRSKTENQRMLRSKSILYLVVIASILVVPFQMKADEFSFTISGNGIVSSGSFTTDPEANGNYVLTSITGLLNGNPLTLLPVGSFDGNDNILHTGSSELDGSGISFSAGGTKYDLFYLPSQSSYVLNFGSGTFSSLGQNVTFTDPGGSWGNGDNDGGDGGDNDGCKAGDNGYGNYDDGDDDCGKKLKKTVTPEPPPFFLLLSGLGICLFVGTKLLRLPKMSLRFPE
jgi:hypothetical protein